MIPHLQRNVEMLKSLNPGWEHRLYDDVAAETLLAEFGREVSEAYHKIDRRYGAAGADILRHLFLYLYGPCPYTER